MSEQVFTASEIAETGHRSGDIIRFEYKVGTLPITAKLRLIGKQVICKMCESPVNELLPHKGVKGLCCRACFEGSKPAVILEGKDFSKRARKGVKKPSKG